MGLPSYIYGDSRCISTIVTVGSGNAEKIFSPTLKGGFFLDLSNFSIPLVPIAIGKENEKLRFRDCNRRNLGN